MEKDALSYGGMCPTAGGWQSFAPPPLTSSCKPGAIVPGCKSARRYNVVGIAAGADEVVEVDPFNSYQIIALVDRGSGADVTLDAWTVDEENLFTKVENDTGQAVAGLGLVAGLDPELYRSGLNPLPPQPLINNVHPAVITFNNGGVGVEDLDILIYLGNPKNRNGQVAGRADQGER